MSLINDALKRAKQAQRPSHPAPAPLLEPVVYSPAARTPFFWLVPAAALILLVLSFWFFALWWRSSHSSVSTVSTAPPAKALLTSASAPITGVGATPHPVSMQVPPAVQESTSATITNTSALAKKARPNTASKPGRNNSSLKDSRESDQAKPARQARSSRTSASAATPVGSPAAVMPSPAAMSAPMAAVVSATVSNTPTAQPSAQLASSTTPGSNVGQSASGEPTQFALPQNPFSELKLQAVFYRISKASVLINGHTMFIGDEIKGAKLVGIERFSAQLAMNGQTNVLRLR